MESNMRIIFVCVCVSFEHFIVTHLFFWLDSLHTRPMRELCLVMFEEAFFDQQCKTNSAKGNGTTDGMNIYGVCLCETYGN